MARLVGYLKNPPRSEWPAWRMRDPVHLDRKRFVDQRNALIRDPERADRNKSVERPESLLAKPEICVAALLAAPKAGVLCRRAAFRFRNHTFVSAMQKRQNQIIGAKSIVDNPIAQEEGG